MSQLILTAVAGDPSEIVTLDGEVDLTLGAEDVLVAVEAAPIIAADLAFQQGRFPVQPQVPQALGAHGVGRVLQAGPAANDSLVGCRVLVLPTFVHGTWGDHVVVRARDVVPTREDADALQLAMLAVNPATAYSLLNDYVTLEPGDWIGLTLAGNSSVGQYVMALARRAGVRTLAVVRRERAAQRVRALGAERVVLDGDSLADRVAETLGGATLRILLDGGAQDLGELTRSVEDGGTVVAFAAVRGQPPVVPLGDLFRGVSLHAFFILRWIRLTPRERLERIYAELAELVAQGILTAAVEATYPLERYREALAHAARSQRSGSVLFTPGSRIG